MTARPQLRTSGAAARPRPGALPPLPLLFFVCWGMPLSYSEAIKGEKINTLKKKKKKKGKENTSKETREAERCGRCCRGNRNAGLSIQPGLHTHGHPLTDLTTRHTRVPRTARGVPPPSGAGAGASPVTPRRAVHCYSHGGGRDAPRAALPRPSR